MVYLHALNTGRLEQFFDGTGTMSEQPTRYFEEKDHAEAYAKYRIPFTAAVVDCIVRYVQDGGCELNMAVDIGCGTGHQSTIPLSRVFKHVIGVDVSREQIRQTPHLSNADFRVARGEDMPFLESSSVDVVSVATAIHWLDLPDFYKEVDRVLRPRGCLAVYWMHRQKLDNTEAQEAVEEFHASTSEYRPDEVKRIWDKKEIPECPYGTWLHDTSVVITKSWTVEDFIKLTSTMSFWQKYLKANQGSTKLKDFGEKLSSRLRSGTEETRGTSTAMEVKYLVNILLCRKPNL
ncbi:putative methyltransferase DDB_G0268948 isoform X2 [Haliotis rufescens]|uniref:putative methyltransferase DDB_G0268948 isoform X2 n=1 Tax=Haliotis rufescens TaxID=6454 RepID=UPI00201F776A|nr:putative methyltransferase DDB_G0268948 isoform X2 [Haliotis rufescens]